MENRQSLGVGPNQDLQKLTELGVSNPNLRKRIRLISESRTEIRNLQTIAAAQKNKREASVLPRDGPKILLSHVLSD